MAIRYLLSPCGLAVIWCIVECLAQQDDASCSRVDFNEAALTALMARCGYTQEFVSKQYSQSSIFAPFRPNTEYYMSTRWEGLTCGETAQSFNVNHETELRMVYSLKINSGATLEIRVLDMDRLDSDDRPTVVVRWKTEQPTSGWGLFREKLEHAVKRAKIQIEANMNYGSDVAIEYFTVFNYLIETEECRTIDEFAPVTTTSSTTAEPSSTTDATTTSPAAISTTSEHDVDETSFETSNSPRDDDNTSTSTEAISVPSSTDEAPDVSTDKIATAAKSVNWVWIALAAVFAALFCLATTGAIYIYAINRHLHTVNASLCEEIVDRKCPSNSIRTPERTQNFV